MWNSGDFNWRLKAGFITEKGKDNPEFSNEYNWASNCPWRSLLHHKTNKKPNIFYAWRFEELLMHAKVFERRDYIKKPLKVNTWTDETITNNYRISRLYSKCYRSSLIWGSYRQQLKKFIKVI